jgi:hypothetical protein
MHERLEFQYQRQLNVPLFSLVSSDVRCTIFRDTILIVRMEVVLVEKFT